MPRRLRNVRYVEIDMDYCSLTFGEGDCPAVLYPGDAKCFNCYYTCAAQEAFDLTTKVIRFVEPDADLPASLQGFPCLESVDEYSNKVNIGGIDDTLGPLGRNTTVSVTLVDFKGGGFEQWMDKYFQERLTGEAYSPAVPRDLRQSGYSLSKLRARWPYYYGRNARVIEAVYDGDTEVSRTTRHYTLTEWDGPTTRQRHELTLKDALDLIQDDKAVCPATAEGYLSTDITDAENVSFTLTPAGIGDEQYDSSGYALIDSEAVAFTRVGDVVTLTQRGIDGTTAASHEASADFQQAEVFDAVRIDDALKRIIAYSDADPAWIPEAEWEQEVTDWASDILLTRKVYNPTGLTTLIMSMIPAGFMIWWDAETPKIGLRINRPAYGEDVPVITDDIITSIEYDDGEDNRLTRVVYLLKQIDETVKYSDEDNYSLRRYIVDSAAEALPEFGVSSSHTFPMPWFNDGNTIPLEIAGNRLLSLYNVAPYKLTVTLPKDALDTELKVADLVDVETSAKPDIFGAPTKVTMQVIERSNNYRRRTVTYVLQMSAFSTANRLISIMPDNATDDYNNATEAERATGFYLVDETTLRFDDGGEPYEII